MRAGRGEGEGTKRENEHEINNSESAHSFLGICLVFKSNLYYFLDFIEDKTLPKNRGYGIK